VFFCSEIHATDSTADRMQREQRRGPSHAPGTASRRNSAANRHAAVAWRSSVHHMVTQRCVAPQPVLHPERGVEHRIILLGGAEFEQMRARPNPERNPGRVT